VALKYERFLFLPLAAVICGAQNRAKHVMFELNTKQ